MILFGTTWYSAKQCLWHESASYGGRVAIKSSYPRAHNFFVNILCVDRVEPRFLLQQLLTISVKPGLAAYEDIRSLMITIGAVLGPMAHANEDLPDITQLRSARFLPCLSAQSQHCYKSCQDEIYVADDPAYRKAFEGKICVLDFSYEDLTALHPLLRLLGLRDRYLSDHVESLMEEVEPQINEDLTARFRLCAYAISWYCLLL